jgi:ABC-type transport system involved in multi-copper enzyme maturation permease subunit
MSVSTKDTMPIPPVTVPLVEPRVRKGNERFSALTGALHSEWIKVTSLRSNLVLLLIVGIAGLVVSWAVASFSGEEAPSVEAAWFYWTPVVAVLAAVVGVQLFTAELQHGTMSAMLVVQPSRRIVVLAKVGVVVIAGLLLGTLSVVAGVVGAAASGVEWGDTSNIVANIPWALGYTTLSALLGLGMGLLIRSGAIAIAGVLIWGMVIEGLLAFFLPAEIGRFLPFLAGDRMLALESEFLNTGAASVKLTQNEGALVLAGYALLVLVVGALNFHRRDAS